MTSRFSWIYSVGIAVFCFASLALTPLQDPSEGRYATIAQTMLHSGNWIVPMTFETEGEVPFLGKPPLSFWAVATSFAVLGETEFAARLPSFIATLLMLTVLFKFCDRFFTRDVAWMAAVIYVSSLIGFFFAGACMLDPILSASVVVSVCALPLAHARRSDHRVGDVPSRSYNIWDLYFFVAIAGGLLCKGPVALILIVGSLFPWLCTHRDWRMVLRGVPWIKGLALVSVLVAPWYLEADIRTPYFLNYFLVHENILRFLVKDYGDKYGSGHVHFRGMIWLMLLLATLPWVLVAFVAGVRPKRSLIQYARLEGVKVLLGLALVPCVFFTLSRQVSVYYTLPSVPALSVLLAEAFRFGWVSQPKRALLWCTGIVALSVAGSLGVIAWIGWMTSNVSLLIAAGLVLLPLAVMEVFWQRAQRPVVPLLVVSRAAFAVTSLYMVVIALQVTDLRGGASCRDLIALLERDMQGSTITFVKKIPHSAFFYSRDRVGDSIELQMVEDAPTRLAGPTVMRQKLWNKLPPEQRVALSSQGRVTMVSEGEWVILATGAESSSLPPEAAPAALDS